MPTTVITIDSGKLISSLFVVRGDRSFTVHCPSQSTGDVLFAEFAQSSAGTTRERLSRLGTGASYVVASGTGNMVGVVQYPATSFARLVVTSRPSAPMSYTVNELNRV